MNRIHWIWSAALLGSLVFVSFSLTGCSQGDSPKSGSPANAQQNLTDEELIKAQGKCPITKEDLGSMGKPVKVMVKDQPVFLCCESCREEALADPEKTLATVEELKRKNAK
jgi:hypothetical protein